MNDTLLQDAMRLHQAGNLADAARLYSDILRGDPRHLDALFRLGHIHLQNGRHGDAEHLFALAVKANPQVPEFFYARGVALGHLRRREDALAAFASALALKPDYFEARNDRGVILLELGRFADALSCFDRILREHPEMALVEGNRAPALSGLGRHAEAILATDKAIAANPGNAAAWYNRGAALAGLSRLGEALQAFDRAAAIKPDYLDALSYRGIVLSMLNRHEEALASYDSGLRIAPDSVELHFNRAAAYFGLKRFAEAMPDCEAVLRLSPDFKYAPGNLLHCKLQLCDWRGLEEEKAKLGAAVRGGKRVLRPLQNVLIGEDDTQQLAASRIWMAHECPPAPEPVWRGEVYKHKRIRIAYVSADFSDHAVAQLMAGVFEHHDRDRFEVSAISLGPDRNDPIRNRLRGAFEHFIDASSKSDADIAALLRESETDIAVDLMGYTEGARTGIFARRPAPVQVNYLGFAGTMAADYIDYILADALVAPAAQQAQFGEAIVHLPNSFMPNDATRAVAPRNVTRAEAGLPMNDFVFCAFNNLYKLQPQMFDIWMRLVNAVPGSVLWLSQASESAMRNLRREAQARGVDPDRLVFAGFVAGNEEHLARLRNADLFLDTLPYNAHAGGCDALWAGVPVVTALGTSFAGRVGASLVSAAGVPELAAPAREAYEALALNLARDTGALGDVRAKLARNRETCALFDTARFTRNLESAYRTMSERQKKGERPAPFAAREVAHPR